VKRAALPLVLVVFGVLTVVQLDLPGLYYDEALDVVPTMQILLGQPVQLERGVGVWIGGTALPVMVMDYVGAVNTYLTLPFFALLGVNVYSLRLMTIVASGITLVLGYRLGRRLFGESVGLLAVLLLAVHPSFVFWSRMGITVTSVMTVFSLGSLLAFLNWWERSDIRWLALGCLLLGVGLWAKLLFLWWIVALAVVGASLVLVDAWRSGGWRAGSLARRLGQIASPGAVGVGLVAFGVGCAPLLWYNMVSGATLETLRKNLVTTEYGVNNLDVGRNLAKAWETFGILLNGSYFWYQGGPFSNDWYLTIFLLSAAGASLLVAARARQYFGPLVAVLGIVALVVVQSSVTVSGHWATHLFILYPLPQLVIALFVVLLLRSGASAPGRLARWLGAILVVAPLVLGDLYVDYRYQATMNDTRGLATASNSIYRLADYLDSHEIRRPIAVDWGFSKNIQILTQGRVNPEEIYGFGKQASDVFVGEVRKRLADPSNLYLFHTGPYTVYPRLDVFTREAERMGRTIAVEEVFYQQDGQQLYLLVSAK